MEYILIGKYPLVQLLSLTTLTLGNNIFIKNKFVNILKDYLEFWNLDSKSDVTWTAFGI